MTTIRIWNKRSTKDKESILTGRRMLLPGKFCIIHKRVLAIVFLDLLPTRRSPLFLLLPVISIISISIGGSSHDNITPTTAITSNVIDINGTEVFLGSTLPASAASASLLLQSGTCSCNSGESFALRGDSGM